MSWRVRALAVLAAGWVLAGPVPHAVAEPDHESVWPSPATVADEHAQHTDAEHEAATSEPDRPVGVVLGVFGGVNGAVMLSAAVLRRRERAARLQRLAERSRRRAVPAGGAS